MTSRADDGMAVRRAVLGDAHVDRATTNVTPLDTEFQKWITESVWGWLWADPTFDHHIRSLITIAILAALGREELALHIRASERTGVTDEELAQVLHHVAVYAGVPAANHAFGVAKSIRDPVATIVRRQRGVPVARLPLDVEALTDTRIGADPDHAVRVDGPGACPSASGRR
jgi:4-carboxymuconolactone decarboxylase